LNGYCAERDDVLFSIQRVLFNEVPQQSKPAVARPSLVQPKPVPPRAVPTPTRPPIAPPPADGEWTDRATGAGSSKALRRDLMLDLAIPASASDALVVLSVEVQRECGAGLPLESETLDGALRCVTRAARSRLGSDGRVYRSERHGLTLLLRGYRGAVADLERGIGQAANEELSAGGLADLTVNVQVVAGV